MFRNALEPWHLLLVAVVFIVLFGSKRLPDTARSLGKSLRILKSETRALKEEDGGAQAGPVSADMHATGPAAATGYAAASDGVAEPLVGRVVQATPAAAPTAAATAPAAANGSATAV